MTAFFASNRVAFKGVCCAFLICMLVGVSLYALMPKKQKSDALIRGVVLEDSKAVPEAVVRIQTTEYSTVTSSDGSFVLVVPDTFENPVNLTAWAKGYFIGGPVKALAGQKGVVISLLRHNSKDNPDYKWLSSFQSEGVGENKGCSECHSRDESDPGDPLPVDEWKQDAHSRSASNPRFLSLYSGTDLSGRKSSLTTYIHTRDYGTFPFPPDKSKNYFGPGYKLDFPNHAGNCAACHLPAAAVNSPYGTDPTHVTGVGAEGINCDFCHKIWDVRLDPITGLPFKNRPGVMSFEFRRPFGDHQFFAGPLDDIAPGEDTFSELQKKSQICAPCHFGVFWDTIVYNSFGEWLESPYSDPDNGKTCQDCHMPHSGASYFALPEKGGLKRDPKTIVSHRMPGGQDKELLTNAVSMDIEAQLLSKGMINVKVTIENDLTGHHVPTDSPLRHMILIVRAIGESGQFIELVEGPTLPEWCGVGDPEHGYYSGLPGKTFVKLLQEEWTKVSPTGAYWNPTRIVEDTRIRAFDSDTSEYLFQAPETGSVRIEAVLLYRRAHKELMDFKGWTDPDIVMEKESLMIPSQRPVRN